MKKFGSTARSAVFILVLLTVFAGVSHAALTSRATFVGTYGLSTDGFGDTSNSGTVSAFVPVGATVTAAYLYSATNFTSPTLGTVTLGGSPVIFSNQWTNNAGPFLVDFFRTGFSDVTSIVAPVIDGGPGGTYNFNVTESLAATDGEALVVVYSLPSLPTATVAILDGPTSTTGDTFTASFSTPLEPTLDGFFAEMRLGISFSANPSAPAAPTQVSQISVNGTTISNNAGNFDDGTSGAANGALITVGGNDDPFSPNLPTLAQDHERYNLVPQIVSGDETITVSTFNQSNDDNIFLAAFYLLGEANVNPTVPEPGTMLLLSSGLIGLAGYRRKLRRK